MSEKKQRVVVLGASANPERYGYKVVKRLLEQGHEVVPVNRGVTEIEGMPVLADIGDVTGLVDTLTMYVNRDVSTQLIDKILKLKPGRVIFNPGSNNPALQIELDEHDIPWIDACTLVLLRTGQF